MKSSIFFAVLGVLIFAASSFGGASNAIMRSDLRSPIVNSDTLEMLQLGLSNAAKEMCSCLFVVGRSQQACEEYVEIDQIEIRLTIDRSRQSVRSSVYGLISKEAKFVAGDGCQLVR